MSLEDEFHAAVLRGYQEVGKETGYWANYFIRDVKNLGALTVAKKLLSKKADGIPATGLQTLIDHHRADLSIEALVLSSAFSSLFTAEELDEAQFRLHAVPAHAFRRKISPLEIRIEDLNAGKIYREGAACTVVLNAYERSEAARKLCIAKYGARCKVCEMTFGEVYGEIGEGFIHVHHIRPLAAVRKEYELNPVKDLLPVCPNCHAMLHSHDPPLTVEELRQIMSL